MRKKLKQQISAALEWIRHADLPRIWSLGGLSKSELVYAVFQSGFEHDLPARAAQLSFYFLLAIFPLLIFVSAVLGFVFAAEHELYARLLGYFGSIMPWSAYDLVSGTVNDITAKRSGGTVSFGLALTLWTGSSGMVAVIEGLNVAYRVPEKRPWWRRRIVALVLTISMGILAAIAMMIVLAGGALERFIASMVVVNGAWGMTSGLAQWTVAICCMLFALIVIYRFAPNLKDQGIEAVLPGALVALVGWLVVSSAFRLYLAVFDSFSRTYGSLGAVIVLLFWLYLSASSLLVGGEVNSVIRRAAGETSQL